ncbi:MAG: HAD family hydrolase [Maritimibacter sp.]
MQVRAVLFDKDGTLFAFGATWGRWAAELVIGLAQGDRALARHLGRAVGFDLETQTFEAHGVAAAGTVEEIARAFAPILGQPVERLNDKITALSATVQAVPAVPLRPLLGALSARGLKLGLATNDVEASARAQLEAADVSHLFDFIAGYDSGFGAKPAPDMCLAFAEALRIEARHVVMVGDSLHDLLAGRAAGMATVGVLSGVATEAELRPFADVVLPDISALPLWLETGREPF